MSRLTFSVVIPTYNRTSQLKLLVEQLAHQTFDSFEVVIVDDGSSEDVSPAISGQEPFGIRLIRQSNAGPSAARNQGVKHSQGDYLVFLDDDDVPAPRWLEGLAQVVEQDPDAAGVACCAVDVIDLVAGRQELYVPNDLGTPYHSYCASFLPGAYAVRRELFTKAGGFSDELRYGEHHELALRVLALCAESDWQVLHTRDALLVKYHERTEEAWQRYLPARVHSVEYLLRHHKHLLARDGRVLAGYFALGGVSAARLGEFRRARSFFFRAFLTRPWNPRHLGRFVVSALPPLARRLWR